MYRELKNENRPSALLRAGKSKIENRLAGFTLTETVVASTLLIIAIVPILKGLTNVHLNTVLIEQKSRSLILAQSKFDEIKVRSIYHYSDTFTENDTVLDGPFLCDVADSGPGGNVRTVTVSVGYDLDGSNSLETDEIQVALTSLLARRWADL